MRASWENSGESTQKDHTLFCNCGLIVGPCERQLSSLQNVGRLVLIEESL